MIYRILHNRLQDHARNSDILQRFIHIFAEMNISGKADIQNINIIVDCFQFLTESRILLPLFDIIAEKICHFFYKNSRLLGILHHGKLCSCVQRIKKKMRIDLGLQIFQLCFFQMILHKKLSLHHLLLLLHTGFCSRHIQIQILHHCIKRSGHHSKLILCIGIMHFYPEISLTYQLCCLCHVGKRNKHFSGRQDQKNHSTCYNHKHNDRITDLQIAHHCAKYRIGAGILLKHQIVQFINRTLNISVKFRCFIIFPFIFLYISASFGSYGLCRIIQISFRHLSDITLQKFH